MNMAIIIIILIFKLPVNKEGNNTEYGETIFSSVIAVQSSHAALSGGADDVNRKHIRVWETCIN